jgi:hypothetical protein
MADTYTVLNLGIGGDVMDESLVTYPDAPTTRKRERIVIAGDSEAQAIADVINESPAADAYALIVRNLPAGSATPTVTPHVATGLNQTLLAANANRRLASIYNGSSVPLNIKLGAVASLTSFTIKLFPSGLYEVPGNYTGNIDGMFEAAIGSAYVTELT